MKYLIVKCIELDDQWECDANREIMFVSDDWKNDCVNLNYDFEVYELQNDNTFKLIKKYDEYMTSGMALCYWDYDDDDETDYSTIPPTVVFKYEGYTRNNKIPMEVNEYITKGENFYGESPKSDIKCTGSYSFILDNKLYVYGEYKGSHYSVDF